MTGRRPTTDILAPREWEYLRLRATGLTHRETAQEMGITYPSSKRYLTAISHKVLGQGGNLARVLRAVGWLTVPGEGS